MNGIQKELKSYQRKAGKLLSRKTLRPSRKRVGKAGLGFGDFYNVGY